MIAQHVALCDMFPKKWRDQRYAKRTIDFIRADQIADTGTDATAISFSRYLTRRDRRPTLYKIRDFRARYSLTSKRFERDPAIAIAFRN